MGIFDGFLRMLGMKKKEASVIVVGLDNSGKSTVLNYLKPEESKVHDIVPTIGFNVDKFKVRSIEVTAFDMSGKEDIETYGKHITKIATVLSL